MFRRAQRTLRHLALATTAVLTLHACSAKDPEADPGTTCDTEVTSTSSPTTGVLTMNGSFFSNETVILRYQDGTESRSALGTPATDRSSFSLSGIVSGTREFKLVISCDAGQDDRGFFTYTVK